MSSKKFITDPHALLQKELGDAYDFDRADPMAGLTAADMSGNKLTRRTVLRLMAASGTLSVASLLPGIFTPGTAQASGPSGGTLRCGWAGTPELPTLDPAQINMVLLFQVSSNVLSGLTHIDADLVSRGDLAESWEVSAGGTDYVFKLRQGVTFHNGDPFTADDVLYTYNRSKNPEKSIHSRVLNNVESVEKIDAHTVRFKLGKPQASFLTKTLERASGRAMTIVSGNAIESMGTAQYGLTPVGTGPFKVTEHTLGQGVVLEKFQDYYDPERPNLDKVIITPVTEAEPLAAALEAGDIQLIGGNPVAPELVDRFVENPDIVVNEIAGPGFQSVWMNPWRDPFKVPDFSKPVSELMKEKGFKVRLAIAKGLDRERYIRQAQFGRAIPAYGTINPAMGYYFDKTLPETSGQKYDLEEARQLLADAGYPDGKGFPELHLICTATAKREVTVIANILKKNLNITVKPAVKDWPVLLEHFQKMDFDMLRVGSGGDYDPDDGIVDWMQTSSKFNGRKRDKEKMPFGFFSDPEVDALITEQSAMADIEKRRELIHKIDRLTSDKVASVFLYHPMDILVHHKSVNFPAVSRIPGLVDLDRTTIS